MLKTKLKARFLGFTDKGKAVLEQEGKLDMLRCYGDCMKNLRGHQFKDFVFTCKTDYRGRLWITNVETLEEARETDEE